MWKIEKNGLNEDGEEMVVFYRNNKRVWTMSWNEMVTLYWGIGKVMGRD